MRYCVHCGVELEEDSKFCTSCGAKVEQDPGQPVSSDSDKPASSDTGAMASNIPEEGRKPAENPAPKDSSGKSSNKVVIVLAVALAVALVVIVCLVVFIHPASSSSNDSSGQSQAAQQQSDAGSSSGSSGASSSASNHGESDSATHHGSNGASSDNASLSTVEGFRDGAGSGALISYSASSVLPASEYGTYVASNLDDGALDTAWVEGATGSGAGQSVKMSNPSGSKMTVCEVQLMAGYTKSEDIYYKNARPKQVSLVTDSGKVIAQVTLVDSYREVQSITFPAVSTSSLTLRIDSVYEGNKYEDCAISEMRCY